MSRYTLRELIDGIRRNDNELIRYLYKTHFPPVRSFIISNQGSEEDAKDVFQDSIVVIYRLALNGDLKKALKGKLKEKGAFESYFFTICKNTWLKVLKLRIDEEEGIKDIAVNNLNDNQVADQEIESTLTTGFYQRHFLELDDDCQRVLELFFRQESYDDIAETMGYKNADYARRRKYLCQKFLTDKIKKDPYYQKHTKR